MEALMSVRTFVVRATVLVASIGSAACDGGVEQGTTSTSTVSGTGGAGAAGGAGGIGGEGTGAAGGQGGAGAAGGEGGQGGQGGQAPLTGTDTCPGDPYDIAMGQTLSLAGTTSGQTGDYSSYCGNGTGSGPDVVYAFTPIASGTMSITLVENSNGLNGVIYAQQTCGDPSVESFINCQDTGSGAESFAFHAEQDTTYHVFVDGRDATEGDYLLEVSLQPGVCGDGVVDPSVEDCDFGDTNPGDGCDPSCQFELPSDNSDTCDGEFIVIPTGTQLIQSFTTGYASDYAGYTDGAGGAADCEFSGFGAPDRVFALVPTVNGTVTLTLPNLGAPGGGFDGVLAAWEGACGPVNPMAAVFLGCADDANDGGATEVLTFGVTVGTVYFVVIDGYSSVSYGNFELTIELN
jgi:cysteine-rich repeat protein